MASHRTLSNDLKALLTNITLRGELLECKATDSDDGQFDDAIEELTDSIEQAIVAFPGGMDGLYEATDAHDYFVDVHFVPGTTRPMHVYLGHVVHRRAETIDRVDHTFFFVHPNEKGFLGAAYPPDAQPELCKTYTNKDRTWVDWKKPINYSDSQPFAILERFDEDFLAQLRIDGEINYAALVHNRSGNQPVEKQ